MAQPTANTQKKQFRIDRSDGLFVLGLTAFSCGIGLAVSWPWALVGCGVILMGLGFYSASRSG